MRIKHAIFDFDGTLFDTMGVWDTVGECYLRSLGIEPRPGLREAVRTMSLEGAAHYFREEYGVTQSAGDIIEGINAVVEAFYRNEAQPKPGAAGFLECLRESGVDMCVATATDRHLIDAALGRCDMAGYFKGILTDRDAGCGKDRPDIYRMALELLGGSREDTVVFEDALHAARTAAADGFITVGVFDNSEPRQAELEKTCRCVIMGFDDIPECIKAAAAI